DYSTPLVVLSLLVAMGASGFALWTASNARVGQGRLAGAAVAMGIAIAGMHYIGMGAMRVNAMMEWNWGIWWLSIGVALAVSYVALNLFVMLGQDGSSHVRALRGLAAVVMGVAVAGMHYTGMAAVTFFATDRGLPATSGALGATALAVAIALAFLVVAGISLVAAMLDRVLAARRVEAELRAAKDAAERTNRAKSEFLSNMSHELRTPLNSVIGFANILRKNKAQALGTQDLAYLDRIVANGKHLLGLINGILDLSKIEAGRIELEFTTVDVGALVRETVLELDGQTAGRDVTLSAVVPDGPCTIEADQAKLKQILINLIGNALKFTPHGSVTVRVEADAATGRPLKIDVIDTGVGIPANRLAAVFEAFQQADSGTARQFGGTGLGLTITRSLAQLMSFDVKVTSEPGLGSTFSVMMEGRSQPDEEVNAPTQFAADTIEATGATAIRNAAAGRRRRALTLVIDDDADSRSLLSHHFRGLGCDVVMASGAKEGIALARRLKPDLVTLDVMMPRTTGVEALHDFRMDPNLSRIPVVLVSAVAAEHRGRVFGVADCLDKPVTSEMLADVLERNVPAREEFAASGGGDS
ncbi:MAG: ATP-binding protein, partial [Gemmatimonadaceae bacterium]